MEHLERLMKRYPMLAGMREEIELVFCIMKDSYEKGGKLLVCGNGGSAADSDHIVGELMKGFYKQRKLPAAEKIRFGEQGEKLQGALPAIALSQHSALSTFSMQSRRKSTCKSSYLLPWICPHASLSSAYIRRDAAPVKAL